MKSYKEMSKDELLKEKEELLAEYEKYKNQNLKLDMSRGKHCKEQLDLSNEIFDVFNSKSDFKTESGTDCRNYGDLYGINEAKKYFAELLSVKEDMIMACGASSLNMMYNVLSNAMLYGLNGNEPWKNLKEVKFLCPSPGYDRHFAITEHMGIKMINIPYIDGILDIDTIEKLVKDDENVKGIWCVPKYENPLGTTYSDDIVKRLGKLKPKAKDFIIMWDNAYIVHDLYDDKKDELLNIFDITNGTENENMVYEFASTSKITLAGGGISCIATSANNLNSMKKDFTVSIISYDKVNMLRHVRYLKNKQNTIEHMRKHAALLRPKFDKVKQVFEKNLNGLDIANWTDPLGGYFITFFTMNNIAKKVFSRCKEAGVTLTSVGAAFPYSDDPNDNCIRIAPSLPKVDELETAAELFTLCVRIESIDKILEEK